MVLSDLYYRYLNFLFLNSSMNNSITWSYLAKNNYWVEQAQANERPAQSIKHYFFFLINEKERYNFDLENQTSRHKYIQCSG